MTGEDGSAVTDRYRLITTLLDPDRFPAAVLIRLYHERWEIESAYLALRHTMLAGHVLRSGDRYRRRARAGRDEGLGVAVRPTSSGCRRLVHCC